MYYKMNCGDTHSLFMIYNSPHFGFYKKNNYDQICGSAKNQNIKTSLESVSLTFSLGFVTIKTEYGHKFTYSFKTTEVQKC